MATKGAPKYFFDNDAFKTHFMNALSIVFPEGERVFIGTCHHSSAYLQIDRHDRCGIRLLRKHYYSLT